MIFGGKPQFCMSHLMISLSTLSESRRKLSTLGSAIPGTVWWWCALWWCGLYMIYLVERLSILPKVSFLMPSSISLGWFLSLISLGWTEELTGVELKRIPPEPRPMLRPYVRQGIKSHMKKNGNWSQKFRQKSVSLSLLFLALTFNRSDNFGILLLEIFCF